MSKFCNGQMTNGQVTSVKIEKSWFTSILEFLAVAQWVFCFLFLGFGLTFFSIYIVFFTNYYYIPLLYLIWYFYDRKTPSTGGRPINSIRNWYIWKLMANYFPVTLHKTTEIDPSKNYLFTFHPHGVLAIGAFLNFSVHATNFRKIFPGCSPYLAVLQGHFDFPFYREYALSGGFISCKQKSLTYMANHGKGNCIGLIIGGAPEALYARTGPPIVKLAERKGFCKMALRAGLDIVPVFSFGDHELYDQISNPDGSLLKRLQDFLTPFFGFSPVIFYGYGLIPFRRPVHTVVGSPIEVEKVKNPTQKQIDELHQTYVEKLQMLYDENKHLYSRDPSLPLIIK